MTQTNSVVVSMALALLAAGGCKKKGSEGAEKEAPPPAADPAAKGGAEPAAKDAPDPEAPVRIADAGLATPESVLYDQNRDVYLVSNINGTPFEVDDNGFISIVSPDGKVVELRWIDGAGEKITLNAPKGMAIWSGTLFVADIDHVRMFDAITGAPAGEIAIKGATFLNDVAARDGMIYVTDSGLKPGEGGFAPSGSDAVYAIDARSAAAGKAAVTRVAGGDALARPNGLVATPDAIYMVAFGGKDLSRVDPAGKKVEKVAELPHGSNDGVVAIGDGRLLVSSWECRCLVAGPPSGPFEQVAADLESPADIALDSKRGRVVVPHFQENAVGFVPLPAAAK